MKIRESWLSRLFDIVNGIAMILLIIVMIIAPIIFPEAFRDSWKAYRSGDRMESYRIFSQTLLPFIHMFGPGDEIPTTKALFRELGLFSSAETRLPLLPADAKRISEMMLGYEAGKNGLQSLGSLGV